MTTPIHSHTLQDRPGDAPRSRRLLRNALLTVLAVVFVGPGPFLVAVPWYLTRWTFGEPFLGLAFLPPLGAVLLAVGTAVLAACVLRFVVEGEGTPAPFAPPRRLVRRGLYRHVRHPMYLAIPAILVGQGLLFSNLATLSYALGMTQCLVLWVIKFEEPSLRARHGAAYEAYCRAVPGWWPRLRPVRTAA